MIQILNTHFSTSKEWTEEEVLKILQKANSKKEKNELIKLIKKSNLVTYVRESTNKSKTGKGKHKSISGESNSIQDTTDNRQDS